MKERLIVEAIESFLNNSDIVLFFNEKNVKKNR
jgi:hypothetical protein